MEVYLIRHTTPDIEKGICYGQTDVLLKASFDEETKIILQKLPANIEIIYTSTLTRCRQLANYLSSHLALPIVEDVRLKELNFGDWEMKKWDDIDQSQLKSWMHNYVNEKCPNGESYYDLACRATSFLTEIKLKKLERALIVTHHGIMKALYSAANQIPLEEAMKQNWGYGVLTVLGIKDDRK
jgi:alpha-ribazole phosphatase